MFAILPRNLAKQIFSPAHDHVRALENHVGEDLFDIILCNDNYENDIGSSQWVRADEKILSDSRSYCADLVDDGHPWRHDSAKLAQVIMDIFYERTGPLTENKSVLQLDAIIDIIQFMLKYKLCINSQTIHFL